VGVKRIQIENTPWGGRKKKKKKRTPEGEEQTVSIEWVKFSRRGRIKERFLGKGEDGHGGAAVTQRGESQHTSHQLWKKGRRGDI